MKIFIILCAALTLCCACSAMDQTLAEQVARLNQQKEQLKKILTPIDIYFFKRNLEEIKSRKGGNGFIEFALSANRARVQFDMKEKVVSIYNTTIGGERIENEGIIVLTVPAFDQFIKENESERAAGN